MTKQMAIADAWKHDSLDEEHAGKVETKASEDTVLKNMKIHG